MGIIENLVDSVVSTVKSREPVGTINVVDYSPLNWLYITYNTVEELIRTDPGGHITPAAMSGFKWLDDVTLGIKVREGEVFQDGELFEQSKAIKLICTGQGEVDIVTNIALFEAARVEQSEHARLVKMDAMPASSIARRAG